MGSHTSCPSETCPVSTERWTRRVHFVREGGGGGVPAPPPASPGCTPRGAVSARTGGPVAGWQAGGRGAPAGVAHGGGAGIGDVARRQELALALRRGRRRAGLRAGAAAVRARARRTGRKLRQVVPRRARLTTEGAPRAGACLERGAGREDACARARGACLSARAARPGARGAGGRRGRPDAGSAYGAGVPHLPSSGEGVTTCAGAWRRATHEPASDRGRAGARRARGARGRPWRRLRRAASGRGTRRRRRSCAARPVSTEGGTRRVQLVREGDAQAPAQLCGAAPHVLAQTLSESLGGAQGSAWAVRGARRADGAAARGGGGTRRVHLVRGGGTRLVRSVRGRRGGGGGSAGPERGRGCVAGGPAGDEPRVGEDGEAALLEAARGAAAGERGVAAFPRLLCAQVLRARGRPAQPRVPDGEDQRRPAARARARAARAEGERPRPGHLLNLPGARRAGGGYAGGGYAGRRRRGGGGGAAAAGAAGCTVAGHGAHSGRYASRPTHAGALRAPAPHAGASALRRGADACAPPRAGLRARCQPSVGPASGDSRARLGTTCRSCRSRGLGGPRRRRPGAARRRWRRSTRLQTAGALPRSRRPRPEAGRRVRVSRRSRRSRRRWLGAARAPARGEAARARTRAPRGSRRSARSSCGGAGRATLAALSTLALSTLALAPRRRGAGAARGRRLLQQLVHERRAAHVHGEARGRVLRRGEARGEKIRHLRAPPPQAPRALSTSGPAS